MRVITHFGGCYARHGLKKRSDRAVVLSVAGVDACVVQLRFFSAVYRVPRDSVDFEDVVHYSSEIRVHESTSGTIQ